MKNKPEKPDWEAFWRATRQGNDEVFAPIRFTGPEDFGDTPRARRWAFGSILAAFALTVAVLFLAVTGGRSLDEHAARQAQGAQAWMAGWPQEARALPVEGVSQCPTGPSPLCARVSVSRTDLGGNERQAELWLWPEQNWVRAWVPLAQWRLAHAAAISAPKSEHGQWLMRQEAQARRNAEERLGVHRKDAASQGNSTFPDERGQRLWDTDGMRGPLASRVGRYADDEKSALPALVMTATEGDAIALFEDGTELPARDENGQWFLLAQGSMAQSGRLAAALMASAKEPFAKDPGETAQPAGWRWKADTDRFDGSISRSQALSDLAVAFGGETPDDGQRAGAKRTGPAAQSLSGPSAQSHPGR